MRDEPKAPTAGPRATRKQALGTLAVGTVLGTAFAALGTKPAIVNAQNVTDTDILNFALNLEYLEAEFYNYAVNGKGIGELGVAVGGSGSSGQTAGGKKVSLSGKLVTETAQQLAHDELTHVQLLRQALGKDAVAKPAINLAALGVGFDNLMQFLLLARAFEDTGVSAYGGAAPLIQSKDVLGTAARILAAEAEHAGNIRLLVGLKGVQTKPLDSKDVLPPPSGNNLFSLDDNALAIVRTPQEVLAIVKPFFPNGLNGTIK
ncbi:MAG: ferritin-like domain-containing protein [Candidatus Eremiobacteraeota bacterium]|nr:ferritin-like domain-containing protein [Candidatus Eremiobacteraeota bacterium]MBC5801840.1 ferritin-like domain-containing protein [Candidatus Eremiobacteraeota bacterium]MBC5822094.1 ferritin-like domain-containing protein [Candidatus Eremiobacteraeota bacterium]